MVQHNIINTLKKKNSGELLSSQLRGYLRIHKTGSKMTTWVWVLFHDHIQYPFHQMVDRMHSPQKQFTLFFDLPTTSFVEWKKIKYQASTNQIVRTSLENISIHLFIPCRQTQSGNVEKNRPRPPTPSAVSSEDLGRIHLGYSRSTIAVQKSLSVMWKLMRKSFVKVKQETDDVGGTKSQRISSNAEMQHQLL